MSEPPVPADADSPLAIARRHRLRREGRLPFDLHLFVVLLREVGIPVSTTGTLAAIRALDAVMLRSASDVYSALFATLVADAEEGTLFDLVFSAFWSRQTPTLVTLPDESGDASAPAGGEDSADDPVALQLGTRRQRRGEEEGHRASYSNSGRRPSTGASAAQEEMMAMARRLERALARSRGRRMRSGEIGDRIDVRDSLRRNLGSGEELMELRRTRQMRDRARLAVLCDVSSSMAPFTPLFLSFAHALTSVVSRIETAIFNVEPCSVTDVFRRRPLPEALDWLRERSVSLAGGTRIGHCLHAFNQTLALRGMTGAATTVLILSDGWDVGEPELLETEAQQLRDAAGQVIWLDPHAAATGFQPQVRGLRIVLPYVDEYRNFSSPESLGTLVAQFERGRAGARAA